MKKYILILLIFTACSKSEDPSPANNTPTTDASIKPFQDEFLKRAKASGVAITQTITFQFGTCDCLEGGVWKVNSNAKDSNLGFFAYHAMGHAYLGKPESTTSGIMNQGYVSFWLGRESLLLDELFK